MARSPSTAQEVALRRSSCQLGMGRNAIGLTSDKIGFARLPGEGSIYIKRTETDFISELNAVDDQLYFATSGETLRKWFEKATMLWDKQLWHLQSITHFQDYSIILYQSRYAALVVQRYGPMTDSETDDNVREKIRNTSTTFRGIFKERLCSATYRRYEDPIRIWIQICLRYMITHLSHEHLCEIELLNYKIGTIHAVPRKISFQIATTIYGICSAPTRKGNQVLQKNCTIAFVPLHIHNHVLHRLFIPGFFGHCEINRWIPYMKDAVIYARSMMPAIVSQSICEAEYCIMLFRTHRPISSWGGEWENDIATVCLQTTIDPVTTRSFYVTG
jgi:hypothetical protein